MKTIIKGLGAIIFFFILIISFFYFYCLQSVPTYNGSLKSKQVSSSIKIHRDNFGIPHIIANTETDAAFALGFVHAQERLFQMDFYRRLSKGKLSEVMGIETLEFDMLFKTYDFQTAAKNELENLDQNTLNFLKFYVEGINYFLDEYKNKLPLEFSLLNYVPEKWNIIDIALVSKLLAWQLNMSMWADVAFARIYQEKGKELAKALIPDINERQPLIISEINFQNPFKIESFYSKIDKNIRNYFKFVGSQVGSNNWAISPKKSLSGKAIIANDPHLPVQIPSLWYIANIYLPELEISGVTIPGTPFIIVGTNKKIAWTVTNVMADDCDFYLEEVDTLKKIYRVGNNYYNLIVKKDTILIKDSKPKVITIIKTHRGPIISRVHPYNALFNDDSLKTYFISLRWTALERGGNIKAYYNLNRASDWQEFKLALSTYSAPAQNFVYADSSGNIGYICGGALPSRRYISDIYIYDGTKEESDWIKINTTLDNPMLLNPDKNYIATANNKVIDDENFYIGNLWEPSNRSERINYLLNAKNNFSIKDFFSMQQDVFSIYPIRILSFLFYEIEKYEVKNQNYKKALKLLKNWNGEYNPNLQAPLIFETFFIQLLRNILLDELGDVLFNEYIFLTNVPLRVLPNILEDKDNFLFDNIQTPNKETREEIIIKSFEETIEILQSKYGKDISTWQWGNECYLSFEHIFSGKNFILDQFVNAGKYPFGGSPTTISKGEYSLNKPFKITVAPSFRFVYDFKTYNRVYLILPTGQSGNVFSKNYANMSGLFVNNNYLEIKFDREDAVKFRYKFEILP